LARSKEFEETEVLDKAMRLFWDQGYEKTSMSELVEHMGIHRKSIYDTFGDKHMLFLKAFNRYKEKIGATLTSGVKRSATAMEALRFYFDFMIRTNVDENLPSGCLSVNSAVELATRDSDVDAQCTRAFMLLEEDLKDIIYMGQQNGEFTSDYEAQELAEYLHNVLIGIRVLARTSASKEKLQRLANISMKFIEK
jgi:TetR/AcrR family transcriptional regulator, transcriptional repressor for nem operon